MLRPDPVSPAYLLVQTFPKHPPRLAEFGNILGIRQLPAGDSISRTDDIEIGRNEAFRANRIDQHPPRSFTGNLERRNRGAVAGIDIGCHAIHIEYTVPKPKKKMVQGIMKSTGIEPLLSS
jgi:hypothetical protein